jgi:hypothetical protein
MTIDRHSGQEMRRYAPRKEVDIDVKDHGRAALMASASDFCYRLVIVIEINS